jgi:hypothetical protein
LQAERRPFTMARDLGIGGIRNDRFSFFSAQYFEQTLHRRKPVPIVFALRRRGNLSQLPVVREKS